MRCHYAEHLCIKFFNQCQHVIALHEGHFKIELCELRLTIAAQILISETSRDLEVTVHACYHQQLLELLRRLWQGIELTWVHARRDEVVARTFRRGLEKDGSFYFDKVSFIEVIAHELDDFMAQSNIADHAFAAQIEITIFKAHVFVRQIVITTDHKR